MFVYYGHHKAASGWINGILRDICFSMGWRFSTLNTERDLQGWASLGAYAAECNPDVISYRNAHREQAASLNGTRGFHVIRDPRDIIVSAYFSHRNSHGTHSWPELQPHRDRLRSLEKDEGLMEEIEFSKQFLNPMRDWDYSQPNVLELKYEEITAAPQSTFEKVARFVSILDEEAPRRPLSRATRGVARLVNQLHLRGRHRMPGGTPLVPFCCKYEKLRPEELQAVLRRRTFQALSGGRKPGQENAADHYRQGKAGDWRNHFKAMHLQKFRQLYGDLCVELGYAPD